MSPEQTPPPETMFHLDDLNEVFNEKLPRILRNAPYGIIVEGFRPYETSGYEQARTPELLRRLWHQSFGRHIPGKVISPDFVDLNFIAFLKPDEDSVAEYEYLDLNWSNGNKLRFQTTELDGMVGFPLGPDAGKKLAPVIMTTDEEFVQIVRDCQLPAALRLEGKPMEKIDNLVNELHDSDRVYIERVRSTAINPVTEMDIAFTATYGKQEGTEERGLVQEISLDFFRAEAPTATPHFMNSCVFKLQSDGRSEFYAAYDCPLTRDVRSGRLGIAEHRLRNPSIALIEQMRQALLDLG